MAAAAIASLVLLAALASSAGAAPRYASPNGSGNTCAEGSPCKITVAVSGAHSGDTVVLAGNEGSYGTTGAPLTTELKLENGVSMQGAPGQPMPQIFSEFSGVAWAVRMEGGNGVKLSDVAIHAKGGVAAVHVNSTMERVLALGESANGCDSGTGSTIIDSVCAGRNGIFNSAGNFELTLRNDTIYGTTEAGLAMLSASGGHAHIGAINTIVRGTTTDVEAHGFDTATVAIGLDHSNYANVKTEGGATVTAAGSSTNQTAAALLTNPAANDFTQTANSPTIDAGINDAANGPLDLAGNGRMLAGRIPCPITDIGAYEYVAASPPPCLQPVLISGPANPKKGSAAPTTTILKAKVKELTARFRFKGVDAGGAGVKFECKLDGKKYHRCRSPKAYKNLKPGKHKFLVRAVSANGVDSTPGEAEVPDSGQRLSGDCILLQEGRQLGVEPLRREPPLEDRARHRRGAALGSSSASIPESLKGWTGSRGWPTISVGCSIFRRCSRCGAVSPSSSPSSTAQRGAGPLAYQVERHVDQLVGAGDQRGDPRGELEGGPRRSAGRAGRAEGAGDRRQGVVEHRHLDEQARARSGSRVASSSATLAPSEVPPTTAESSSRWSSSATSWRAKSGIE